MIFAKKRNATHFIYNVSDAVLESLRVTVGSYLQFNFHIDSLVNKAIKIVGSIKRQTADFKNVSVMCLLFFAQEYCYVIWSQYYTIRSSLLENLQIQSVPIQFNQCTYQRHITDQLHRKMTTGLCRKRLTL